MTDIPLLMPNLLIKASSFNSTISPTWPILSLESLNILDIVSSFGNLYTKLYVMISEKSTLILAYLISYLNFNYIYLFYFILHILSGN